MKFRVAIALFSLALSVTNFASAEDSQRVQLGQAPVAPQLKEENRPTIFDGLRGIIGDSPAFDDNDATDGLVESLNQAEKAYKEIRQSNREAIRGMNRQIRIGRAKQSPHIVLLTIPQLRFDHLAEMPRLNGIRTSGVTFTNYYAPADQLATSRWSLLSGNLASKTPEDHAVDRKESLAEAMWQAGYETAMIGTWTSRQHPIELGYDHWTGFPSSSGAVEEYPEFFYSQTSRAKVLSNGAANHSSSLQLMSDEVTSYLKRHQHSSRQFYLHVGLPFLQGADMNENIQNIDLAIGEIVDSINQLKLGNRICLLVTGETSHNISAEVQTALPGVEEKLTYSTSGMNEGNLRTPLIVFWGMNTTHGSKNDFPCTAIDFLPTFKSLAYSNKRSGNDAGVSLINCFRGNSPNLERLLYWRMKDGGQVARRGRWKIMVSPDEKSIELYDLLEDPSESMNVAAKHPDIVKSFIVNQQAKQTVESQAL